MIPLLVTEIRSEADRVKGFTFVHAEGYPLPTFEPGAHIELHLDVGPDDVLRRRYSLTSDPSDASRYEIAVLRAPESRGGSAHLHDAVDVGDVVLSSAPRSEFIVGNPEHAVLVAGGIGITPIISMARALVARGTPLELHYTARSPDRMAFRETLGVRASTYFSGTPSPNPLDLRELLEAAPDGAHVYVCGPRRMIEQVRTLTAELAWTVDRVHFESFGSAPDVMRDRPFDAHLSFTGATVRVAPEQTLLDALLDAGVWASYECKRGECGSCATPFSGAEVEHRDAVLTPQMRERYLCTCVSRPTGSAITLEL